jgi:hypothetical protein
VANVRSEAVEISPRSATLICADDSSPQSPDAIETSEKRPALRRCHISEDNPDRGALGNTREVRDLVFDEEA